MASRSLLFVVSFALGLVVRAFDYPRIVTAAGVQLPAAGDSYYHLRRIWFSVARFPERLPFDLYVGFPSGGEIIWPSTFDWAVAAAIRPFVDPGDQAAVEALAIWVPPVLGAATTGVVGLFAAHFYGRIAGWCAGSLYALLPIGYIYSRLGEIDHHVAVDLLAIAALWIGAGICAAGGTAQASRRRRLGSAAGMGAAAGSAMFLLLVTWPGSLLQIALLQLGLALWWLAADDRGEALRRGVVCATSHAVAAVLVLPCVPGTAWQRYGSWSPLVLSGFQPLYLGCAAATIVVAILLHRRTGAGATVAARVASTAALAIATAGAAILLLPTLREAISYAGGWFSAGEEMLGYVYELRPILAVYGRFDPGFVSTRLGPPALLLPIVWVWLAREAWRRRSAAQGLILAWALGFALLTLAQWRFGTTLALVYPVLVGAAVDAWARRLRSRRGGRGPRIAIECAAVLALTVWTLVEFRVFYAPLVAATRQALRDESVRNLGPLPPARRLADQAARWIARNTPPTRGYLDRSEIPEYGILTSWSVGHLVRYRSERPMVQDNFGPFVAGTSFERAGEYFRSTDEEEAFRIATDLGARYVLCGTDGAGWGGPSRIDSMTGRLSIGYGTQFESPKHGTLAGLAHHRLILRLALEPPRGASSAPRAAPGTELGVFEVVPGARIEGRGDPGSRVELTLPLALRPSARLSYRRSAVVGEDGTYRIVVPYPTDRSFSTAVRALGPYELRAGDELRSLGVREVEVRSGASVPGPDFRGATMPAGPA